MRNIKDFQARYDRWKNGERYWDIRGVDLPRYNTGDKNTNEKTLDQKAQEEREFQANHPFLANVVKNTKEISKGWDNFWENNLFRYPAMVATGGVLGKAIQRLGRIKKAADLIKLRKNTAHLDTPYRDTVRSLGLDLPDRLASDILEAYGKFQQTPIGALLPFNYGKEGNSEKKNDFYTWLDQISNKKAQDWTKAPIKPLSTDEVYADMLNDPTYNYKTFYDLQPYMAERMITADPNAHFTDIGKTMYHPTFSNESAYSGYISDYNPLGITGGSWNEDGTEYTPSMSQLANYWNYNRTRDYLDHAEDHPVKINLPEYYTGKGGPSRSIRKYIANAEGSHFARQNRRWGGDAVGTFYKRLGNIIGNDTWDALTQNQRDALTSYYYNIKPSSFNPTLNAIRQWATNGMKHDDLSAIRDTINVGMNNKKLSGLRKRRLYEQDLFMKDIQPTGIVNGNIVQQVPSNNIQIPMNPEFNINTITVPIQPDIRSILNPRINIPLKPELYPDQKPDGSFDRGKSGIYINPANRGKFNATKKRTGKTTEELIHSKNPLTRKRAQFALNARKWKH